MQSNKWNFVKKNFLFSLFHFKSDKENKGTV